METRQKNYTRADGTIGESSLSDFDKAFNKCIDVGLVNLGYKTDGCGNIDRDSDDYRDKVQVMMGLRRYMLAQVIEMFGSWYKKGDCFPHMIVMGKDSGVFASVIIEEVN